MDYLEGIQFHIQKNHLLQPNSLIRMTTSRPEILVQGSNDLNSLKTYEFQFKPGDITRPPPYIAPHQPRLDWQVFFIFDIP